MVQTWLRAWSLRLRAGALAALRALALTLLATAPAAAIELQLLASALPYIVDIQHAGDGRLFFVSQAGTIRVWNGTTVRSTPFLDLSKIVRFSGEQGLLGLAFHPNYASNGYFYVNYSDTSGDTVIARYRVSADPNVADPASAQVVLTFDQPFSNHNGGQLRFGPDGYLYIASGDGGSGGDPQNNAQRLDNLLGKILRIDVNAGTSYAVPSSNPFVNTAGARGEIWSYGLRNPWRFSFDRTTGDMFVGDVGQSSWEEIDYEPAGSGGRNYGWRLMEGTHCFNPASNCNDGSLTLPILEYSHSFGCSVTGGFRYRGGGSAFYGAYFYADYCSGRIWSATPDSSGTWSAVERLDTSLLITTFGEDVNGELYVSHHAAAGAVYRLTGLGGGFTDDPLVSGSTTVRALHITQLRSRIDALRTSRGLPPYTWTDASLNAGSTTVRAIHVTELRDALDGAYSAAGRPAPAYTDSTLPAGTTIKAIHITELRNAVLALE